MPLSGPYRDAREVLLAKRLRLRREVEEAEHAAERADDLRKELAIVEYSLRASTGALLATVRIATPCRERWEDMAGDDVVRHCLRCKRDVFDLSAMRAVEAEAFLARGGDACVRLRRRRDGRVVTADCPPPPMWARKGMHAGALALAAAAGTTWAATRTPDAPPCAAREHEAEREEITFAQMGGLPPEPARVYEDVAEPETYWVDPTSLTTVGGRHARLVRRGRGLLVRSTEGTALEEMGLQVGDTLIAMLGAPLEEPESFDTMMATLVSKGRVTLTLLRGGLEVTQTVAVRR